VLAGKAGPRLALAARLGFAARLNVAGRPTRPAWSAAAGGGVGCAIDATGQPEAWEQAIAAADKGGTIVFFGGCVPGTSIRVDTRRVHYEELRLLGVFHHTPALIRRAVALLADGSLDPMPLVTHEMGLADVPDALAKMARGEAMKVLIHP
jgi:L-iditol 2-dehydrogenase